MGATVHVFDDKGYSTRDGYGDVPELLKSGTRFWLETADGDRELAGFFEQVLKLHPLAVEDILQDRPSPKVEDYGDYIYVVAHAPQRVDGELCTYEVDLVWSAQWIVTHRHNEVPAITTLRDELKRTPRTLEKGPAFIAHTILDRMVDSYLPIVDAWDDDVDQVETDVVEDPSRQVLQRIFKLKRELQRTRRSALHQREVLYRLSRGEFDQVPENALPFYRDVHDHFLRVVDLADSYRDLLSGSLDAYLSVTSNRMNEIMKTLTLVATILLPLTFIVGVYGMNFEFMPELHWRYGYLMVWIVIACVASTMLWLFRRRGWL